MQDNHGAIEEGLRRFNVYARGHLGLALLISFGLLVLLKVKDFNAVLVAAIATALSTLPDVDLKLGLPHRKYTHNVTVGVIAGVAVGILFLDTSIGFLGGFLGGFGGVLLHLIGDAFTHRSFKPFLPFSGLEVGFKVFRSSNRLVNEGFLCLGLAVTALYIIIVHAKL
ncbi:MAG: hypothetical protein DRN06_05060, partial [Thermoprotei archaeon]